MNGKSCKSYQTLYSSCEPIPLEYWCIRQNNDLICKSRYSCVGDWYHFFCLLQLLLKTLIFFEKFVNLKFVQVFNGWAFSCGKDETRTQNLLIPRQKSNHLFQKNVIFPSLNLSLLNLSLIFWRFTCVLDFALLCLVKFLNHKPSSGWVST